MNMIPISRHVALAFIGLLVLSGSCQNKDKDLPVPVPRITTLAPNSGGFGTEVIISGTNFSETILSNTVTFNGKPAPITAASLTSLTATVPLSAESGPVTVQVGGQTSNAVNFTYVMGEVSATLAGNGLPGFAEGSDTVARFKTPLGVTLDANGNLYVADQRNHRIRKISAAGVVSTLAGNGTASWKDGSATTAEFYNPSGVAADANGNVFVADYDNHRIRKVAADGTVSTLAGGGNGPAYLDATGIAARFAFPTGVAVDVNGNVYVADRDNHLIRKITGAGVVTTLAGKSETPGYSDGSGASARFNAPNGVAVDGNGNVYVAEFSGHRIRKITPDGTVSTVAGNGTPGFVQGTGTAAQFNKPAGVAVDKEGNLFVADVGNNCIRKITPDREVSVFAGTGIAGATNGPAAKAEFNFPISLAVSASSIYVADANNHRIVKIENK